MEAVWTADSGRRTMSQTIKLMVWVDLTPN